MKAGWDEYRLDELCEIRPNKKISKEKLNGSDEVSFVGMKELGELNSNFTARENRELSKVYKGYTYFADGDVLIAKITPCFENGKMGIARNLTNGVGFGSSEFVPLRTKGKITPEYLFYFLLRDEFRENGARVMSGAVGHKRVPKEYMEDLPMPVPPLEEQKRIVAILDEAFAGLDRARAHTEANLQNARDLFEAFLYGVFQTGEEKWEQKEWGNICNFVRGPFGGSLKKSMFVEKGYAVYEQKHAIHDHFNQLRYFIDEEKFSEMRRFEVKAGDLIMSCSGVTLGRVAIIPDGIPKGIINQALLKLTPSEILSVDFLKHWLRSKVFQDIIFEHAGGAAIPNVPSAKILKKILLPVPSLEEQNQLVADIDSMLERTKSMEGAYKTKLADLDDLRQSLLQKAFAGELT